MKNVLAVFLATFLGSLMGAQVKPNQPAQPNRVPLYRLASRTTGDHLYTTSAPERNQAEKQGYVSEGEVGNVFASPTPGTVPLYRLLSTQKGGGHFMTTSAAERDNAVSKLHYRPEGVSAYVSPKQAPGSIPLYRLMNPRNGDHFYTATPAEREEVIRKDGFHDEGIAGYIWPSPPENLAKRIIHAPLGRKLLEERDERERR